MAGRFEDAILLFQQTLADHERVLGLDHPDTLGCRNNHAYETAGRLGEAVPLYERTVADSERVLGGDQPFTMLVRRNLETAITAFVPGGISDPL